MNKPHPFLKPAEIKGRLGTNSPTEMQALLEAPLGTAFLRAPTVRFRDPREPCGLGQCSGPVVSPHPSPYYTWAPSLPREAPAPIPVRCWEPLVPWSNTLRQEGVLLGGPEPHRLCYHALFFHRESEKPQRVGLGKNKARPLAQWCSWECVLQGSKRPSVKAHAEFNLERFSPHPVLSQDLMQLLGVIFRNILQNTF